MTNYISTFLAQLVALPNRLTDTVGMYRLVTLSLLFIVACSLVANLVGLLFYSVAAQLVSLGLAVGLAIGLNVLCAKLWRVHANHESALITALILFFLVAPKVTLEENAALLAAVTLAIISKFLFVYRRQHIFNAAALGAVGVAFGIWLYNVAFGTTYNTDIFGWWVSNPVLLWPVLLTGLLIVAKTRRMGLVASFILVGLAVFLFESFRFDQPLWDSTLLFFVSYPTLFLAFFMLTEPFTMPPKENQQIWYGALVGALSSTTLFVPWFAMTPELALVLGNAFAYIYRIKPKLFLQLQSKRLIATDTWEFTFSKPDGLTFEAGQYVEWMLPHSKTDSRGPRRYFTIASSPTETVVRLALKVVPTDSGLRGSTYKQALLDLDEGEEIIVSQLGGDFILPPDSDTKVGFIAGGIGVTPFSSHLSWMKESGKVHDTHLYYCCNTMHELAYLDEFTQMEETMPIITIPVIVKEDVHPPSERGFVTKAMLERRTPDYRERTWYISGPPGMVNAYQRLLKESGVPARRIKTDFFPGLA